MAVTSTLKRNTVFIYLVFDISSTGARLTHSVSLGPLKKTAFTDADLTKVYAVIDALSICFNYPIYEIEFFTSSLLDEE